MEKGQILEIIKSKNYEKIVELSQPFQVDNADALKQYDPYKHDVTDPVKRPKRRIKIPIFDNDGKQTGIRETEEEVTRVILALQQMIVQSAAGVLCSNPIKLESTADLSKLTEIWNENKLDFKTTALAEGMMSELSAAELWYKKGDKYKVMLLQSTNGDTLYPVFDDYKDLIAFVRSYKTNTYQNGTISINTTRYEIYTDELVYTFDDNQKEVKAAKHGFSKIPVIYYAQPKTEWHNVQPLIDHLEKILSNLGDTNIRFSNPILTAVGNVQVLPGASEQAKAMQIEIGGDLKYLTWDNAIASLEFEVNKLINMIFFLTQTIDLSPQNIKNLFGTAPSGYAIELMFTSALWKASRHEDNFGSSIQRRINLMKTFTGIQDSVQIKPQFTYFVPKNIAEQVDALTKAKINKLNSDETLTTLSPFTSDTDKELQLLKDEAKAALSQVNNQNNNNQNNDNQGLTVAK